MTIEYQRTLKENLKHFIEIDHLGAVISSYRMFNEYIGEQTEVDHENVAEVKQMYEDWMIERGGGFGNEQGKERA